MKISFLTIVFCFLFLNSCKQEYLDKKAICACGVNNPTKNIPWLAEFIEKAKSDETGKYLGVIWLEQYNAQDVFVIEMAPSSAIYEVLDCEGNHLNIAEPTLDFFNNLKKDIVIYVHPDYPLNL
jgi:hypothetical protein